MTEGGGGLVRMFETETLENACPAILKAEKDL